MIIRVDEFRHRVQHELSVLVSELQTITSRFGKEEEHAWKSSLPRLAKAFASPGFDLMHLYLQGGSELSLEYQLPAASSWCDVVLLGRGKKGPGAVIIELKDWQTHGDSPGNFPGLVKHHGDFVLHPSDQVRGYVEYCRRFHSAVHDQNAVVNGCVFFTQKTPIQAYTLPPNDVLTLEFPCFTFQEADLAEPFPAFIAKTITEPDVEFADAFERGYYKQDRGFVRQIAGQIIKPDESPFVLLDNQRRAFSLCRAQADSALYAQGSIAAKKVIVIEGPPGSGKSVVAAKLWAALATDEKLPEGPIVFTSTSASQNSNWSHLFAQTAGTIAGAGVVKKATSYTPITTQTLGRLRRTNGSSFLEDASAWRDHLQLVRACGIPFTQGSRDGEYLVSVVDEAHALINPEFKEGRGQYGFVTSLGPQAYHIIRVSQVTIFLLDERQSFRTRENTTVNNLRDWAVELGAEFFTVSLAGHQFRCAGSKEYVDWVEAVLGGESPESCRVRASAWNSGPDRKKLATGATKIVPFEEEAAAFRVAETAVNYGKESAVAPVPSRSLLEFKIFDTPAAMESALREKHVQGGTVRLLAPYARPWATQPHAHPHDLPDVMKDFVIDYVEGGEKKTWAKVWNFVPKNGSDYSAFIQGRKGTRMFSDPLCEVGCPYAVRGFDWDYVGILWLSDLVFDAKSSRWFADPKHVHETGFSTLTTRALNEKERDGPHHQNLLEAVAQCYRILLTRPIRGVYLWFENADTRKFIESVL